MEESRPSSMAQRVAMKRAAHQRLDDPKVFYDPLALLIIGNEHASVLQAEPFAEANRRETAPAYSSALC